MELGGPAGGTAGVGTTVGLFVWLAAVTRGGGGGGGRLDMVVRSLGMRIPGQFGLELKLGTFTEDDLQLPKYAGHTWYLIARLHDSTSNYP